MRALRTSDSFTVALLVIMLPCDPAVAQSLRLGTAGHLEPIAKLQVDWRRIEDEASTDDAWDLHTARIGVGGELFKRLEFQVERELTDDNNPWRDVYVDATALEALHGRAGKFKVPFSLEMLTGTMNLDFIRRSLAASSLAPGRDVGVNLHGRLFDRLLRYDVGLFRGGGDNVRMAERDGSEGNGVFAVRVAVTPWRGAAGSRLHDLTIAGGVTSGNLPEGRNSLDVRTVADEALFPRVYVDGRRARVGGDLEWRVKSFGVRAEALHVRDDRLGEGTDDNDLPPLQAVGGYLSGTWLVTGEKKADTIRPRRPAPLRGFGAVEVAARYEWISMGTGDAGDISDGPRAEHLGTQQSRVVTLGANWYLNRFVRLQVNVMREHRIDRGVTAGEQVSWHPILRVQVGL